MSNKYKDIGISMQFEKEKTKAILDIILGCQTEISSPVQTIDKTLLMP